MSDTTNMPVPNVCTVVVLNYNNLEFVRSCLLSAAAVSRRFKVKCLIIDDASTDGSQLKLAECNDAFYEPPKIIFNKRNVGINACLRKACDEVDSKYIKVLASDDVLVPEAFAAYATEAILGTHDLILSHMTLINAGGDEIGLRKQKYFLRRPILRDIHLVRNDINAPSVMIRTEKLYEALMSTKARNAEDWPIWRKAIIENWKVRTVQYPLVNYRQHEGGISAGFASEANLGFLSRMQEEMEILFSENMSLTRSPLGKAEVSLQKAKLKSRGLKRKFYRAYSIVSPLRNAYRLFLIAGWLHSGAKFCADILSFNRRLKYFGATERLAEGARETLQPGMGLVSDLAAIHAAQIFEILERRVNFDKSTAKRVLEFGASHNQFRPLIDKLCCGGSVFSFRPNTRPIVPEHGYRASDISSALELASVPSVNLICSFMILDNISGKELTAYAAILRDIITPDGCWAILEAHEGAHGLIDRRWFGNNKMCCDELFKQAGWGQIENGGILYAAGQVLKIKLVHR